MENKFEKMFGYLIDNYNKAETEDERIKILHKFAIAILLSERIFECFKDEDKSNE